MENEDITVKEVVTQTFAVVYVAKSVVPYSVCCSQSPSVSVCLHRVSHFVIGYAPGPTRNLLESSIQLRLCVSCDDESGAVIISSEFERITRRFPVPVGPDKSDFEIKPRLSCCAR